MDVIKALEKVVSAIKTWVDSKKADIPKATTITLKANSWTGNDNIWHQVVAINGVTDRSKVDLFPTAEQIVDLQDCDIAFVTANEDGVITVSALWNKPDKDYTIQAIITDVVVV